MFFLKILDKSTAYAGKGWKIWKLVCCEPVCLVNLHPVGFDLTRFVFSGKAQHEGIGKGPALASEVADVLDLYTHLFHDFPPDCILGALAALHKACDYAVAAVSEPHIMGKEKLVSFGNSCNYRRRENRIVYAAALGAHLGPLGFGIFHRSSTGWAEFPALMPAADMESPAHYSEHLAADSSIEISEAGIGILSHTAAVIVYFLGIEDLGCESVPAIYCPYELWFCGLKSKLRRREKLRESDIIIFPEIKHLILLEQEPIATLILLITENTGFKCHTSLLYRSIITKFRSSSRKGT